MPQKLVKATILIDGMTCISCENRIEQALRKTPGVVFVQVSYAAGTAKVTYDAEVTSLDGLASVIESHDYSVRRQTPAAPAPVRAAAAGAGSGSGRIPATAPGKAGASASGKTGNSAGGRAGSAASRQGQAPAGRPGQGASPRQNKTDINQILGVGIILAAIFMVSSRLGLFNIFNAFPQAEAGMGYGVLFVIGLLTSIHCVAMCGGINLSQCVPSQAVTGPDGSRRVNLRPSLLYNLGRVISYTTVGGIVGALGQVVSFSGKAKGLVAIVAGIFMVIMGLNMLNIFPWLRRFNPHMPKIFARKIYQAKAGPDNSPLYVGLLNGLMPCGPLQAMQIYALSTGSPIKGALSMLLFSLGTVPLMFGLGALSSLLSKRFTQKMMQVSAMLVIVLGVFMFQSGMGVSGLSLSQLNPLAAIAGTGAGAQGGTAANAAPVIENGVQIVTTQLKSGSYDAITVKAGIPVRWTIQAAKGTVNGCNNRLIIQQYGIEKKLVVGDNVIEFTPTKAGTVPYSCWMGMIRSKITVLSNDGAAPKASAASSNGSAGTPANASLQAPVLNSSSTQPDSQVASGASALSDDSQTAADNGGTPNDGSSGYGGGSCCAGGAVGPSITEQKEIQLAEVVNGIQKATITVDGYGYSPKVLVIQKDLVTNLSFDLKQANACSDKVYIQEFNQSLDLSKDGIVPAFRARKDFTISCWMNMVGMQVKVVDDLKKVDTAKILEEVANAPQGGFGGGGGCCG